jgi:hypothetical protein
MWSMSENYLAALVRYLMLCPMNWSPPTSCGLQRLNSSFWTSSVSPKSRPGRTA